MFKIGDFVKIKPPFFDFFPDTYIIEGINEQTGAYIVTGIDFSEEFLEKVE